MRLKSFRTSAAFVLTTLMLVVPVATAQTYNVLYNFDRHHGSGPQAPALLAQGRDGNLYGTTVQGGRNGGGVAFKITPSGKLRVLYTFDGVHCYYPYSGLTLGTGGNFHGTTSAGGAHSYGMIFKITKSGSLTTLYSFTNDTDGGGPVVPPIQGTDGNFYGTASTTAYKMTLLGRLPHSV